MTKLDYAKSRATRDMKYRVYKWGHSPQTIFLVHDGQWYRRRLWVEPFLTPEEMELKDPKTFGWGKWEVVP